MAPKAQATKTQPAQTVWVHDPIAVVNANVTDTGVTYDIHFANFIGKLGTMTVSREDCYFKFDEVLRALVHAGYRYNTFIPQAPTMIQQRLTAFRPDPKSVEEALAPVLAALKETKDKEEKGEAHKADAK